MNLNGKSPVPLWVVLCFGVIFIGGIYVAAKTTTAPSVSVQVATRPKPSVQSSGLPAAVSGTPSPSPATPSSTPADASSWKTYRNEEYGFEFTYEKQWGDLEFVEASSSSTSYVEGIPKPDTGRIFMGTFTNHKWCSFGAITPDYSYPSEGPLFVSAGYRKKDGHYLPLWPDPSIQNLVGIHSVTELTPSSVRPIASNSSEALMFEYKDELLDSTILEAEINLRDAIFPGLAIGCRISDNDPATQKRDDRQGFDFILSSFSYTD